MCYNGSRNCGATAVLEYPVADDKYRRLIMNTTVPHSAFKGNPQTYTIYALAEPKGNDTTWTDVRYIGMSTNVQSRFAQHLACRSSDANEDKSEWIQSLLRDGKLPLLREIEKSATVEEGRAREQYWIRYAISQGADILNRQITYTEEERIQVHQQRAIRNAQMGAILEQGIFVKSPDAWYPPRLHKAMSDTSGRIPIYEVFEVFFMNEQGVQFNLVESPDEDFDAFIKQYITVWEHSADVWGWEDRLTAIHFAKVFGKPPELHMVPQPPKKRRSKKGE